MAEDRCLLPPSEINDWAENVETMVVLEENDLKRMIQSSMSARGLDVTTIAFELGGTMKSTPRAKVKIRLPKTAPTAPLWGTHRGGE